MFSLVISACLSATPAHCEMFEVGRSDTEGFKACRIQMQSAVDIWQVAHPDYIVRSAFCMPGRS